MQLQVDKFELVEIIVNPLPFGATGFRYSFPDVPKLRYVKTQAIVWFNGNVIPLSPSRTFVWPNPYDWVTLILSVNDREDYYRVPEQSLNPLAFDTFAQRQFQLFQTNDVEINFAKSYVLTNYTPGNLQNQSWLFGIYYT